ncbi:hypothetical protein FKM82_005642 [Ascaphus truei]
MYICVPSSGKISYFTHPPETHTMPTHISAEIVTEMGKAFDFEALEIDNHESLSRMPASVPQGISMEASALTAGTEQEVEDVEVEEEESDGADAPADLMDEDIDTEFGPMTVEFKAAKSKGQPERERAVPRAPNLQDIHSVDPLQQGQALRAAGKRRKKLQKRANKIATNLSDSLTLAMNFGLSDD